MSGRKVLSFVMAGLDPAIHEFREQIEQDVDADARHKAEHDEGAGGARQS